MVQNRPRPNFVVLGSLTDRRTCRDRTRSPIRTGSWKVLVFDEMIASGRSRSSFRSKWACSGTAGSVRPGDQWWGRNQTESIVGGAMGPSVRAAATSSSQNSGLPFWTAAQVVQT